MKVSIKFSLVPGKTTDLPIRMRIGYEGRRLDLRTGYVCPPEKWDPASMRMRPGTANRYMESAAAINRELSRQEMAIGDILTRFSLDGVIPEPAELKRAFDIKFNRSTDVPADSCTLTDVGEMFLKDRTRALSPESVKAYISVHNRIDESDLSGKSLDSLRSEDLQDFVTDMWLDGLENRTVSIYVTRIRTLLRYAREKKLYSGSLHLEFRPKFKGLGKKDVYYLEWEEMQAIMDVELASPSHRAVRDAFCFCCATGLRVGDCSRMKWSDVYLDARTPHIAIMAKKTTKPTTVELNKYSRALIERNMDRNTDPDNTVFPFVQLCRKNLLLPQIAKAAGIKGQVRKLYFSGSRLEERMVDKADAISTHWGRHTFIVHALSIGISPAVVMQWTGHSSYDSLKPYVAIVDSTKKSSMALFDQ